MKDGVHVDADFIVAATGLTLQHNSPFSTIKVCIDGSDFKVTKIQVFVNY